MHSRFIPHARGQLSFPGYYKVTELVEICDKSAFFLNHLVAVGNPLLVWFAFFESRPCRISLGLRIAFYIRDGTEGITNAAHLVFDVRKRYRFHFRWYEYRRDTPRTTEVGRGFFTRDKSPRWENTIPLSPVTGITFRQTSYDRPASL